MTRRIIFFILIVILTLAAGMGLPRPWLKPVFHYSGYYFILAAFLIWLFLAVRITHGRARAFFKTHYSVLLLCVALMALAFHLSPPQFKILADETNLVGVSMAMHEDKTVSLPLQGLAIDYAGFNYVAGIDQRPLGYPFFVSLCHALLGYSPYNGFVVNFAAGVLILFFTYLLLSRAFSGFYGILGVLLTAACPVFIFWVTSGGFEALNLFFVVFVLFALHRFLQFRRADEAELLFLSLALLAHCRYESGIFIIGLAVLAPVFTDREVIGQYRLPTFICPVLLLPLIWQRRFYFFSSAVLSNDSRQAGDSLFGFGNLIDHFSSNVFVFSGLDAKYGFLPVVFVLAVAGLYTIFKRWFQPAKSPRAADRAVIVYGLVCAGALFLLYSAFYWGDFTTSIDNRLAMVFLPFMVVSAVYAVYRWADRSDGDWKGLILILAVIQIIYYWPVAGKQALVQGKSLTYEYKRVLGYIETNYDLNQEKLLIISDRPNLYAIHKLGSVGFDFAEHNVSQLRYLKSIYYDHILVLQRPHPLTGKIREGQSLTEEFRLNCLADIPVGPDYCVRIMEADFL